MFRSEARTRATAGGVVLSDGFGLEQLPQVTLGFLMQQILGKATSIRMKNMLVQSHLFLFYQIMCLPFVPSSFERYPNTSSVQSYVRGDTCRWEHHRHCLGWGARLHRQFSYLPSSGRLGRLIINHKIRRFPIFSITVMFCGFSSV